MNPRLPLLLVIILIFALAYFLGGLVGSRTIFINQTQLVGPQAIFRPLDSNATFASMAVPAVDPDGRGVISHVAVQVSPGSGKTLVNIDKILFWVDTQYSIRTAKAVAENLTGLDMSKYDMLYSIAANASVIEGPSAGAALTIVTIAALQNKTPNPSVMITGLIEEDGTIGPASGLLEKARAAKEAGADLFLIPAGLVGADGTERVKNCTITNGQEYCRVEYVPQKIDIGKEVEINVKEVKTIEEALEHFL